MTSSESEADEDTPSPELEMRIGMEVLEHLGMKMYTSLPAAISEYVANAWDAGAEEVRVTVPEEPMGPDYQIRIQDDGIGMTADEADKKFLMVGRKRRREEGDVAEVLDKERRVMGRKGIGKLAGFGIAGTVDVWTSKKGEAEGIQFRMNYDSIQEEAEDSDPDEKGRYKPDIVDYSTDLDPNKHGTIVQLRRLDENRDQRPAISDVRRKLSRRFAVVDRDDFDLYVNDEEVTPEERNLRQTCQDDFIWEIGTGEEDFDGVVNAEEGHTVTGWIGTRKTPVEEMENGIAVMARGKLAQEPEFFGVEGVGVRGQHALQYMVGEVHAEFIDEDVDLIATHRGSVQMEAGRGKDLYEWLHETIKEVCREWAEKRTEEQIEEIQEMKVYEDRIEGLSAREKRLADDFLSEVAKIDGYDEETLRETADYVATAVERKAFADLLEEIEEADHDDPHKIVELFQEWEVLDAVETFRRAENRYMVIAELEYLIEVDIGEKNLQRFLGRNPWLLDPRWDSHEREVRFSEALEEKFGSDEERDGENKRIDFVCLGDSHTVKVIELKRPQKTIGFNELTQLERYVSYIRELEASDTEGGRAVSGYIIGGKLADTRETRDKIETLESKGMYYMDFDSLRRRAENAYNEFIEVVEEKYEATGDDRLEERLESLREKVDSGEKLYAEEGAEAS